MSRDVPGQRLQGGGVAKKGATFEDPEVRRSSSLALKCGGNLHNKRQTKKMWHSWIRPVCRMQAPPTIIMILPQKRPQQEMKRGHSCRLRKKTVPSEVAVFWENGQLSALLFSGTTVRVFFLYVRLSVFLSLFERRSPCSTIRALSTRTVLLRFTT